MSLKDIIPNSSPISFPGLFGDWQFTLGPTLGDLFEGLPAFLGRIHWYGVLIALGLLLGLGLCMRLSKRFGLTEDNVMDTVLWGVPLGVLGARLYYVIFYLDLYKNADGSLNFSQMLRIQDGGLAIYGGIIVGFLTAYILSRVKKFSYLAMMDDIVMGVLIGQAIGRWGNFMNREAFGAVTEAPWRMRLWARDGQLYDVHPTFFYESLWNLIGLLLIRFVVTPRRRFDGENLLCYFLWYGLGRLWIEGLREDSLYLFNATLFGEPVRVSQALSAVLVVVSAALLVWKLRKAPNKAEEAKTESK
ncbi:MAG: prolipoprotein diacylglyceryl transferase [Ruminococcaceae bacterium]|nr:prolipoprotein diacylglyceryl transferase [Oscillospiraceae bacterium]